jgi:hypothetical protein
MTDAGLDRETTAAAAVLESRLRDRDAAVRAGDPDIPDAGLLAREVLLILRGRGWRPTAARPASDWRMHGTGGGPSEETRAALEAVKAACAVSPTRVHGNGPEEGTA